MMREVEGQKKKKEETRVQISILSVSMVIQTSESGSEVLPKPSGTLPQRLMCVGSYL